MELELNVSAPLFNIIDIYDREIDLESYRGKKIFIGFFRHAGCPFCNLRVHALMKEYEQLRSLGMEMIFFFESKKSILLRSIFHKEISPVPLISDPEKIWYATYGLEESAYKSRISHITSLVQTSIKAKMKKLPVHMMADGESINTMPAEFLLDSNLIIRKIHYSDRLNDRLPMDLLKDFASN